MSTAGKVLVVLVMLAAMAWLVLIGGVARLNRNGNEALQKLADELEKIQTGLQESQQEIRALHDQTTVAQEQLDRDLHALAARQADLEAARSQIVETLTRVQYQLAIVEDTIKGARTSLEHRIAEHQAEEKAVADLRSEVRDHKTETGQLMARLQTLRDQFQTTYHTNLELLKNK
jgi:chromosome segregation ATPase